MHVGPRITSSKHIHRLHGDQNYLPRFIANVPTRVIFVLLHSQLITRPSWSVKCVKTCNWSIIAKVKIGRLCTAHEVGELFLCIGLCSADLRCHFGTCTVLLRAVLIQVWTMYYHTMCSACLITFVVCEFERYFYSTFEKRICTLHQHHIQWAAICVI